MRYWVYDELGLLRKFWTKWDAERFLQPGWKIVVQPKQKVDLSDYEPAPF